MVGVASASLPVKLMQNNIGTGRGHLTVAAPLFCAFEPGQAATRSPVAACDDEGCVDEDCDACRAAKNRSAVRSPAP